MTDWVSASAMLLAGLVVGAIFLYTMRRRQITAGGERADLEAKRDALLAQLRSIDNSAEERGRLERETAAVLRKLDGVKAKPPAGRGPAEAPAATPSSGNRATLKGFAWGAVSMAVLAGIAWFVVQSAKPKEEAQPNAAPDPAAVASANDPLIAQLQQQVSQNPDNLQLRDDLARAYLDKENITGVAEQTQYVLKRNPDDARALTYQALVHLAARQPEAAMAMLQRATKSDPKLLDAWVGLAWVHAQNGNLDQAQAAIDQAKKQHPEETARLDDLMNHLRNPQQPPASVPDSGAAANAAPAGQAMPAAAAAQPGEAVHITLNSAPRQYPPAAVLFIIARDSGSAGGPPAAVKRVVLGAFPLKIDLTAADSMMGQPLPPKMRIEARIALDGNPMNHDPKDPEAFADGVGLGKSITMTLK